MSEANVVTSASNVIWYTDKCEIVTGSTPVTYQVYATALRNQDAVGNIYSEPSSVDANSSEQIYVGVGNYLTITGSNYTAQEVGGQTSAQAGVGGYGIPGPPPPPTTIAYTGVNAFGDNVCQFTTVSGESYPCLANVSTGWTINYAGNSAPTGWTVSQVRYPVPSVTAVYIGTAGLPIFPSGDYTFSAPVPPPYPVTPWYVAVGSGPGYVQLTDVSGTYPTLANVTAGWTMYSSVDVLVPVGNVLSATDDSSYTLVYVDNTTTFDTGVGYRFSPP